MRPNKKKITSVNSLISELEIRGLLDLFKENLLLSLLQLRKTYKDILYRQAVNLVSEYEQLYIKTLNSLLENRYTVNQRVDFDKAIKEVQSERLNLLQLLVDFQPTLNSLKKSLDVVSLEDLKKTKRIIEINVRHLERIDIDDENSIDYMLESPFQVRYEFRRHNLTKPWWRFNFKPVNVDDKSGLFIYEDLDRDLTMYPVSCFYTQELMIAS